MTLSVDLFYSFRSPYSYLALPKITKMVADYDLAVNLRPVYPLAVRVPGFFKTNPQFLPYVALDAPRVERDVGEELRVGLKEAGHAHRERIRSEEHTSELQSPDH